MIRDIAIMFVLASRPQFFVRHISHQMDRCSGTNLSQFTFGGLCIAIACDVLDGWAVETMVSGHTKFAPDFGALHLANDYNKSDCFTRAHLLEIARRHGTSVGYGEQMLVDLHKFNLFAAIPCITKIRSFLFMADDGQVALSVTIHFPQV